MEKRFPEKPELTSTGALGQRIGPLVVVDDDRDIHAILRRAIQKSSFSELLLSNHISFESGEGCLEYLGNVTTGSAVLPSVILLDVTLPTLNGFEILESIRNHTAFVATLSIYMLSGSENPHDREHALAGGANGYFIKPFGFPEFVELVNTVMTQTLKNAILA